MVIFDFYKIRKCMVYFHPDIEAMVYFHPDIEAMVYFHNDFEVMIYFHAILRSWYTSMNLRSWIGNIDFSDQGGKLRGPCACFTKKYLQQAI